MVTVNTPAPRSRRGRFRIGARTRAYGTACLVEGDRLGSLSRRSRCFGSWSVRRFVAVLRVGGGSLGVDVAASG